MKIIRYNLVILVLALFAAFVVPEVEADSAAKLEYKVKAAFLYNFTKFVDWPDEKVADANKPIIIGIVDDNPLEEVYEPLKKKSVKGRRIQIRYFRKITLPSDPEEDDEERYNDTIQSLRNCHVLFICGSLSQKHTNILRVVRGSSVLTIGESSQFILKGGIVNFVKRDQKIRFEINLATAREADL
ncbi:MAG: YfiR family protein, partial [Phycisphaerales bacterium]